MYLAAVSISLLRDFHDESERVERGTAKSQEIY
jgi:hypothetical protein